MFWLNFRRIMRSGLINFFRGGTVSLSALLVMIVTLFFISSILFVSGILDFTLNSLRDKVDVNISFVNDVQEAEVMNIKQVLEGLPEVERVEYVSAADALTEYIEKNKDKQDLISAISELDENPLGPILNIKAKQPSQYENVKRFLDQNYASGGTSIIYDINYAEKKAAIEKLDQIINAVDRIGAIVAIVFILLSIFITLNTIRLAIYTSREEINVMKLVGAESYYISGPFIITGAIYGLISAVIVLLALLPITYFLGGNIKAIFFDFSLFAYYMSNVFWFTFMIIGAGIAIGVLSSLIAVYRYIRKS